MKLHRQIFGKAVRAILLAAFGGLMGLLAGEFAVLRGLCGYHGLQEVTPVFQHDPRWGWRFVAGADAVHSDLDFAVRYRINSKGLRQREIAYEKPAGWPEFRG